MDISIATSCSSMPGILRVPQGDEKMPAIVFTNGYCAYKEMYNTMAADLCQAGYVTLQYDNRGTHGEDKGRFMCGTEWLEDLCNAISYVASHPSVDESRIALAGVSMGGALSVMQGTVDPRIKCLFIMAPFPDARHIFKDFWLKNRNPSEWESFYQNLLHDAGAVSRGAQSKPVSPSYAFRGVEEDESVLAEERREHPNKAQEVTHGSIFNCFLYVNPLEYIKHLSIPVSIVHGDQDDVVPFTYSNTMFDHAQTKDKELTIIPGAPHVLPEADCVDQVIELALRWFEKHL